MTYEHVQRPDDGTKISIQDGKLIIPNDPIIPFIEGDGIGRDISNAMRRILDAAVEKTSAGRRRIAWMEVYAGEKANSIYGEYLPQETLDAITEYIVAIKGPLTTPVGGGFRSLNVSLRQLLDLYIRENERSKAFDRAQKQIAIRPENTGFQILLGKLHVLEKEPEKARVIFQKVLEMNPDSSDALFNLARLEQEEGSIDAAIAKYRKLREKNPGNAGIAVLIATLLAPLLVPSGSRTGTPLINHAPWVSGQCFWFCGVISPFWS